MGRGKATFKQSDVARAVKAARAAGIEVAAVRINPQGQIEVVAGKPLVQDATSPTDEVESWLSKHHAHHR